MSTPPVSRGRQSKYLPLLALLTETQTDVRVLSFAAIEQLIRQPLPVTAQVGVSHWNDPNHFLGRSLRDMGWHAHLDRWNKQVAFRRVPGYSGRVVE